MNEKIPENNLWDSCDRIPTTNSIVNKYMYFGYISGTTLCQVVHATSRKRIHDWREDNFSNIHRMVSFMNRGVCNSLHELMIPLTLAVSCCLLTGSSSGGEGTANLLGGLNP